MLKRLTVAALGASLLAGAAYARQDAPQDRPMAQADADHDGVITRDEMLAQVAKRFAAMDANHDGTVTPEERRAYEEAQRARMSGRGGAWAPKPETLAEAQARAAKMFDRMDTNHDGKIDAAERKAFRERMMSMRGHHGPHAQGDMPPPPPPADAPKGD